MNKKVLISVISVIALIVLGFVAYSMTRPSESSETVESVPSAQSGSADASQLTDSELTAEIATITYTDQGFSPSNMTVKAGAKIRVVNNASDAFEFSSDNHPTHLGNSELNMDVLNAGEAGTFTVTRTGEYGFHDHLNASNDGILTVTE